MHAKRASLPTDCETTDRQQQTIQRNNIDYGNLYYHIERAQRQGQSSDVGVLMHKVSPKSATKHRLYDPETGEYLNDETMKAIEQAHDDMKHGRLKTYSSADEMFKDLGINV